jgi:hypothetical protein
MRAVNTARLSNVRFAPIADVGGCIGQVKSAAHIGPWCASGMELACRNITVYRGVKMPFQLDQKAVQHVFVGTWIILIVGSLIFYRVASPALKQKMQPRLAIGVGLAFLVFIYLLQGIKGLSFAAIPVALIMYLNVKIVKYCPKCGAPNRNPYMFPVPKYCGKCGTALDEAASG